MALLTPQSLNEQTPVARTANAVACTAGGDTCPNDGRTFLLFENGDAASHTITVTPAKTTLNQPGVGTVEKANVALAVGAGDEGLLGPFPPGMFNDINGNLAITYSAVTSCKILAVKLAPAA
jgi:hypothetical protein